MILQLTAAEIILAAVFGFLLYIYTARHRNYWKSQNVVHEKPSYIFGAIERLLLKPMCQIDQERYKKFGRVFGAFEQGKPCLFVAEPDLVKQILVKDFQHLPNRVLGKTSIPVLDNMIIRATVERWRPIRTTTSPAFSTGKLRKMNAMIQKCAMIMSNHLNEAAESKEDIDLRRLYGHYTLDVIARTQNPANYDFFINVCERIMKERRQAGKRHEDFLQLMMDAQEGCLALSEESTEEPEDKLFDVGLDAEQASAKNNKREYSQAFSKQHPSTGKGPEPNLDVISKLKYLHCVVSETLRILPTASRLERCGYNDYVLGDTGIKLPKGCTVFIPVYAMHHDPEFFPDPESFKPERFSEENVESIRPYTYLPFRCWAT
ncbi:hypothetical protein MTO96_008662 [Rhipicephalus appendiculatus]